MSEFRKRENLVCGINDATMKTTILKCYSTSEELRKRFDEVENIMYNLKDFYSCSGATELFQKFDDFKLNFATVANNIDVYGDDLTKVRNNFHKMIDEAAEIIRFEK